MSIATPAASSRALLPAISMAIVIITLGIAVVTVLLAVAETFALSPGQTSSLIIASYVIPNVASVILTAIYRQPLFIGWSVMGVVFSASFAGVYTYPELLGTTMVAGAVVLLIGGLGLSARLAQAVPGSVVMGIVAALVMPFVVDIFTYLDESPLLVGTTVITYPVGRRLLPSQIPPILPALALGLAVAGATGTLHGIASAGSGRHSGAW